MKTKFMKPREGGICRWPDGTPVNPEGEEIPQQDFHFQPYIIQGDLVEADKPAEVEKPVEADKSKSITGKKTGKTEELK